MAVVRLLRLRWLVAVWQVVVVALLVPNISLAKETSARYRRAESLFAEAQRLFKQAQSLRRVPSEKDRAQQLLDSACSKYADARQLRGGLGITIHLAKCREAQGRWATAWSLYEDAHKLHKQESATGSVPIGRGRGLRKKLAALAGKRAYLTVVVDIPHVVKGLKVFCDGKEVPRSRWGTAVPVDPGAHRVHAAAPNHAPYESMTAINEGYRRMIVIPRLGLLPKGLAVLPKEGSGASTPPIQSGVLPDARGGAQNAGNGGESTPADRSAEQQGGVSAGQIVGLVLGGVGLVAVGVGATFGGIAQAQWATATQRCPSSPCSDAQGAALDDVARRNEDVALGLALPGAALAAGAVVLWFAAAVGRPAATGSTRITPWVGPGAFGIFAEGRF